jgi:hypothetical protein
VERTHPWPIGRDARRTPRDELEPGEVVRHIRDILHRRTDLSTFVVHLTRDQPNGVSAREVLVQIIQSQRLEARKPFGWCKEEDDPGDPTRQSQRVVCFSETPLEHVYAMLGEMEPARQVVLRPYGLAFPKVRARKMGINPVWYVDKTPGRYWEVAHAIDGLVEHARAGGDFHSQAIAKLLPFIEPMGTWPTSQREFWWEREWRHGGSVDLPESGVIWLFPEDEETEIRERVNRPVEPWIDPQWGLERIVAHLADFRPEDVSPFVEPPLPEPSPFGLPPGSAPF